MSGDEQAHIKWRNVVLLIVYQILFSCGATLVGDTFVNSYLLLQGWTSDGLGRFNALGLLFSFGGYCLSMGFSPDSRRDVFIYRLAPLTCYLLPLCLTCFPGNKLMTVWFFLVLLLCKAVYVLLSSFCAVADPVMRHSYLPATAIVRYESGSYMVFSTAVLLVSIIGGYSVSIGSPADAYLRIFEVSGAFFVLASVCLFRLRAVYFRPMDDVPRVVIRLMLRNGLRDKRITCLLLPSMLRGFDAGFQFIPVAIARKFGMDSLQPGILIAVAQVAGIVGAIVILRISKYRSLARFVGLASTIAVAGLFSACFMHSTAAFYGCLFIGYIGKLAVDLCIPVSIQQHYGQSVIGMATAVRFATYSLSSALCVYVMGLLLEGYTTHWLFLAFGVPYIIGCFLFRTIEQAESRRSFIAKQ